MTFGQARLRSDGPRSHSFPFSRKFRQEEGWFTVTSRRLWDVVSTSGIYDSRPAEVTPPTAAPTKKVAAKRRSKPKTKPAPAKTDAPGESGTAAPRGTPNAKEATKPVKPAKKRRRSKVAKPLKVAGAKE